MQRYVGKLGPLFTRRFVIFSQEINNYWPIKNIHVRYLVQASVRPNSASRKPILPVQKITAHKRVFTLHDLLKYINNGKVFYLKQLTNIFDTIDFSALNSEEAVLLLKCCSTVPDSSRQQRIKVCQDIFTRLLKNNELNIDVFNCYLKACCENDTYVNQKDFLPMMKCDPNKDTFKLLLENVCQHGNITDALLILELMKNRNISVDSDIFNYLILAHTIEGGSDLAETVLNTMRSAHIAEDSDTRLAMLKGFIRRNNFKEFKKAIQEYPIIRLTEHALLMVLKELGLNGNESWLSELHSLYKEIPITREIQIEIEKICIHLIHMGHPKAAMNIYKEFVTPVPEITYGFNLLKEMLHCDISINMIISLAKDLLAIELNEYIMEKLTAAALKYKYVEQAWTLLLSLKTLRPHYFWPLLVHSGKTNGENGVFRVLEKIKELNIKADAETLESYVFPYCDLSNSKLLVLKLQENGFTVREILSPLLIVLLKKKRTRQAVNTCNLYNVDIFGDKLLELLSISWGHTKDATSIITLLRRYCESNANNDDLVGCFLIDCSKLCSSTDDFKELFNLIKMTGESRLRISPNSADVLQEISKNCSDKSITNDIGACVNSILDFGLKLPLDLALTHPRDMDLAGLECHLIELKEKNMQTRGVIRRLIQMHASRGSLDRVTELRKVFLDSGYEESAGIKSSIMHSYVMGDHLDEAMNLYQELKNLNPEFNLDTFKFIDLAKLLITNDKFDEGYSILQNEIPNSKIYGNTKPIIRNCRELLSACKTAEEVDKVFGLLVNAGVCKPTNVILGPLVRVHLKSGDVNRAVDRYIELSLKYRCTPLQFEILCVVTKQENSELLQKVIKATESVHGPGPAQMGLISALAENGQEKALRKALTITHVSIKTLIQKRCARWLDEGKLEPLKVLLNACDRLSDEFVDTHFIYKCIFDLYDLNGDAIGASEFYENIPEDSTIRMHFKNDIERILAKQYNVNDSENVKIINKI